MCAERDGGGADSTDDGGEGQLGEKKGARLASAYQKLSLEKDNTVLYAVGVAFVVLIGMSVIHILLEP